MTIDPLLVGAGLGLIFVLLVVTAEDPLHEAIELLGGVVCGILFLVLLDLFRTRPVVAVVAAGVLIAVGDAIIAFFDDEDRQVGRENAGQQMDNDQNERDQRGDVPPALPDPHAVDRDWRRIGEAVAAEADDERAFARVIADRLEEAYDYRPDYRELFNFLVQFEEPQHDRHHQAVNQDRRQELDREGLPEPEPNQLWPPREAFNDE